jgi:hypothetical protein
VDHIKDLHHLLMLMNLPSRLQIPILKKRPSASRMLRSVPRRPPKIKQRKKKIIVSSSQTSRKESLEEKTSAERE